MKEVDTFFYVPSSLIENEIVHFPEDELNHIGRVLRLDVGDIVTVVDGEGHAYEVELVLGKRGAIVGKIANSIDIDNETKTEFFLALPLMKPSRLEIAVDMAVQLGIKGMWFFRPDRISSEWDDDRVEKFIERIRRIAIASIKQCKRTYLPEIIQDGKIDELLKFRKRFDKIFYGHPFGLPSFGNELIRVGDRYLLLVGPEGDFSARELEFLEEIDAIPISLGPRRLRTETASIALLLKALCFAQEI